VVDLGIVGLFRVDIGNISEVAEHNRLLVRKSIADPNMAMDRSL